MTDTEPTAQDKVVLAAQRLAQSLQGTPQDLAEPEEDELGDDLVFVRNGWLRVVLAGETFKLRRPFLGELRDLELSCEADIETLTELSREMHRQTDEYLQRAREIETEAKDLNGEQPDLKRALDRETSELTLGATKLSRGVVRTAQDLRAKWWTQVFKTLTPPGSSEPAQLPSWVGDATLQQRVIEHWRSFPLGRGSR